MTATCLHAHIHGRVQGVGFRYFVQEHAQDLRLTGWVRNKGEDQVEVWAEGPREDLEKLLAHLEQGPRSAWVDAVNVEWEIPKAKYSSFQIISSTWF